MVTKNTANNANNALNILPEAANTAVDNDEKYLSFALVLAITIMDNLVKLIGTDGFVLYTYTLQDTATARAVFNELARRLKNFNRQEEGNDSNLLIVFYVQIMPDDFVMQLHRF
ncbi:hypothetical protein O5463_09620 [Escherichia coli]|nr:hypothetical protein [Escherichia coli]